MERRERNRMETWSLALAQTISLGISTSMEMEVGLRGSVDFLFQKNRDYEIAVEVWYNFFVLNI